MNKPIVSIARNKDIDSAVIEALDRLTLPDLTNKTILLKPNVGREVDPNLAINTNPKVVESIFLYLKSRYDANFLIGDSPIIATNTKKAFNQSGYKTLLLDKKIQFVDLDQLPPKILQIPNGTLIKKIKITGYLDQIDYIISIPVLKMHMHTGMSLSFKNMKGLIYKREKISLHQLHAPEVIEQVIKQYKFLTDKIKE